MCDYMFSGLTEYDRDCMRDFDELDEYDIGRVPIELGVLSITQNLDTSKIHWETKIKCGLDVVEGYTKCKIHKCCIETCDNAISFHLKYCRTHMCHYIDENRMSCENCIVGNSKYCEKHKCPDCDDKIYSKKVKYCEKHLKDVICEIGDCTNIAQIVDGKRLSYCTQHTCKKCGKYQVTQQKNAEYCFIHAFMNDTEYCGNYVGECTFKGCHHEKLGNIVEMGDEMFNSEYCYNHHLLNEIYMRLYHVGLNILQIDFIDPQDFTDEKKRIILASMKRYAQEMCK